MPFHFFGRNAKTSSNVCESNLWGNVFFRKNYKFKNSFRLWTKSIGIRRKSFGRVVRFNSTCLKYYSEGKMFSDKYLIKQLCSYLEQDFSDFGIIFWIDCHNQILTVLRNFWGSKRFFLPKMFGSMNNYGFKRKRFWSL